MLLMAIKTVIVAIKKQTLTHISDGFNMRSNNPRKWESFICIFPQYHWKSNISLADFLKFWAVCQPNKKRTNSQTQHEIKRKI